MHFRYRGIKILGDATISRRALLGAGVATCLLGGCNSSGGGGSGDVATGPPPATALAAVSTPASTAQLGGVNVAGLEFSSGKLPGQLNTDFPPPDPAEIDYYQMRGARSLRIPFLWERIQPTLDGAFDANQIAIVDAIVDQASRLGMTVLLDAHQYGRRTVNGQIFAIGETSTVTSTHFANFWRSIAERYLGRPVIFNLTNEPHDQDSAILVAVQNEAIAAIRKTGAKQLILASGNGWTGAHSWLSSGNGDAMLGIKDPGDNFAFDVHQYFDSDASGTSAVCVSGSGTTLSTFTKWAKANGRRGFLGEFACGPGAQCATEVTDALAHMRANRDVWIGWTWWGGGAWWADDYQFKLRPASLSNPVDRPQMGLLNGFA